MAHTVDSSTLQIPIPFSNPHPQRRSIWNVDDSFGIWSCRFSADGNEVIAGGSRNIFGIFDPVMCVYQITDTREVYDLPANRRSVSIIAHEDDVNSCCWADSESGNVLISASDDTFIKVWYAT